MTAMWLRVRCAALDLSRNCSGIAATEFAMIVPIMLVLFFGTVELSSAVAIDRKVTLMARTLSDLTSQNISVTDSQLANIFNAGTGVMTPYSAALVQSTITELYIDKSLAVKVQWSKANGGAAAHKSTDVVTVPDALKVAGTYLILSEVSYNYTVTGGYFVKNTIPLNDFTYTRPRQSVCVDYPPPVSPAVPCTAK